MKAWAMRASCVVIREKEDNGSGRHGSDVRAWIAVGFAPLVREA